MKTEQIIETHHLRKVFDDKVAISDLDLSIGPGEVFGFLGPNGAGKTTAVKMLLGLVSPTSGEGKLFGSPLGDPEGRARVGFLPEHFRFHEWLRAGEFLQLHANLCKVPPETSYKRIDELLDLVNLVEHRDRKLRTFSKGMLQRIGLAQALLNNPALVFLDEPTSGLDPMGRRLVRDIIRDLRHRGTTIFLNSHLLSEVEITCDRVAFIKNGTIVYESAMHTLVESETIVHIEWRLQSGIGQETQAEWTSIVAGLRQWGNIVRVEGETIALTVSDISHIPDMNRYLVDHHVDVFAISPQKMSLEDLFMQIIEQGKVK